MLKKLWAWITGTTAKIKISLIFGKDVANTIKNIADSKLLDAVVQLTATNIDDLALAGLRLFLNSLLVKLNWADKLLDEVDEDERIIILHTLSAAAAKWKSSQDGTGLNLQTTLSTPQLIYDRSRVNLAA